MLASPLRWRSWTKAASLKAFSNSRRLSGQPYRWAASYFYLSTLYTQMNEYAVAERYVQARHGNKSEAGRVLPSTRIDPLSPEAMGCSPGFVQTSPGNWARETMMRGVEEYRRCPVGIIRSRCSASGIYASFAYSARDALTRLAAWPVLPGTGRPGPGRRALYSRQLEIDPIIARRLSRCLAALIGKAVICPRPKAC